MDFSKVVEPVADYLNFLINYWVHGKFPTEPIPALGEVNTYVLVLFLLGMFFNFVVIQFRPFDFDPDAPTDKSTFKKIESHAVMSSVPLVVVSALMFEFMLWVFGTRSQPQNAEMGNFADTINGHLLMSAAMAAIFAFLPLFGDQHKRLKAKGRQVIALDVEFAVLVFHHPFGPGDDHRADGIRALNVAVVINLDPLRRRFKIEGFCKPA